MGAGVGWGRCELRRALGAWAEQRERGEEEHQKKRCGAQVRAAGGPPGPGSAQRGAHIMMPNEKVSTAVVILLPTWSQGQGEVWKEVMMAGV
jgi:hypothetical protein